MSKQLLMGNEAFAHAALAAGVRVVAGYPGTPSSEVIETIAEEKAAGRAEGVHVEWSTNEKTALELLAGASYAGARTLFTCKQVGLNVASDALMSLNYVGVKGGMVLFTADDPGPISSQTEQDTRRFAGFAKVPVLDPATPEQGYSMIQAAFELSEKYHTPVIVRSTTRVCHSSTFMEVPSHTQAHSFEGFERSSRWVIFPKRAYEGHGEINERLASMASDFSQDPFAEFNRIESHNAVSVGGAEVLQRGIVTGGISTTYVKEALRMLDLRCEELGINMPEYTFMQIGTPYPFPEEAIASFVDGLDEILVLEELDSVLEDALVTYCGKTHASYNVLGKLTGYTLDRGENSVDDALVRLARFLGVPAVGEQDNAVAPENTNSEASDKDAPDFLDSPQLPIRPPVLCAGCPHRGSFYAVKQALRRRGEQGIYSGDIGCYTLGNAQPLDMVDTCLCMGAGISMAQGFSVVEPDKKQIAFVGDSTFFASGLPGIVNAVYNDHDITVVVLDNATTAMTGAQPHPGTGVTLMGKHSEPISIEAVLRACGFANISHANPFDLENSIEAASEALAQKGPSAVIYRGPCVSLVPPKTPAIVNETCTGCKKCITEIGCPAIEFVSEKRKALINESLCTGCGLCRGVCPFDAIMSDGDQDA